MLPRATRNEMVPPWSVLLHFRSIELNFKTRIPIWWMGSHVKHSSLGTTEIPKQGQFLLWQHSLLWPVQGHQTTAMQLHPPQPTSRDHPSPSGQQGLTMDMITGCPRALQSLHGGMDTQKPFLLWRGLSDKPVASGEDDQPRRSYGPVYACRPHQRPHSDQVAPTKHHDPSQSPGTTPLKTTAWLPALEITSSILPPST